MKKVYIIHGWGGYPKEGWFPWLKKELENKDYIVKVLKMPNPEIPRIKEWVNFLKERIKKPDKNTYLIGHSIGCQTIMRYLETLNKKEIGGIIFVAPWFSLMNLETAEEKEIAKPWIETQINAEKIKSITNNIIAIFSDNDPVVPLTDKSIFKEKLNAKIIIENNKSHFSGSDNIKELPIVIKELIEISKK